jgi:hypothetical protein
MNQQAERGQCARRWQDEARGFVYDDAQPSARQAVPGQLRLVAKRHLLDACVMRRDAAERIGRVLGRLTSAIGRGVGAETHSTPDLDTVLTGGLSASEDEAAQATSASRAVLV